MCLNDVTSAMNDAVVAFGPQHHIALPAELYLRCIGAPRKTAKRGGLKEPLVELGSQTPDPDELAELEFERVS